MAISTTRERRGGRSIPSVMPVCEPAAIRVVESVFPACAGAGPHLKTTSACHQVGLHCSDELALRAVSYRVRGRVAGNHAYLKRLLI